MSETEGKVFMTNVSGVEERSLRAHGFVGTDGLLEALFNLKWEGVSEEEKNRVATILIDEWADATRLLEEGGVITRKGEVLAYGREKLNLSPDLSELLAAEKIIEADASFLKRSFSPATLKVARIFTLIEKETSKSLGYIVEKGVSATPYILSERVGSSWSAPFLHFQEALATSILQRYKEEGLPRIISPSTAATQLIADVADTFGLGQDPRLP